MGEIADMMLDGTMDPETGEFNFDGEDGPGWPMTGAEAADYRRSGVWKRSADREPFSGETAYRLTKAWRKKLEAFGEVRACDFWHWQVLGDRKVLADWWPHKRKWRIGGAMASGDEAAFRAALAKAAAVQTGPPPKAAKHREAAARLPNIPNPFARDPDDAVPPSIEAWARALCVAFDADPDELIGMPQHPRWRSWVGYAENANKAAIALGLGAPA